LVDYYVTYKPSSTKKNRHYENSKNFLHIFVKMKINLDNLVFSSDSVAFVLKRAFRRGYVSPSDVTRALDISASSATRVMQACAHQYAAIVERKKTLLVPRLLSVPPRFASEDALFTVLDAGLNNPAVTGLFNHEVPVVYVGLRNGRPIVPGTLTFLTQSIANKTGVDLVYLPMTLEARTRLVTVQPIALEKVADEWRLIGQDYVDVNTIGVYVLTQILQATRARKKRPPNFIDRNETDAVLSIKVAINPRYTPEQINIIEHEMGLLKECVRMPSRAQRNFSQMFQGDLRASRDIWPPFVTD
jgi:hypothetical protein